MKGHSLATGILFASLLVPAAAQAATFSEIYGFGDSLLDLGRQYAATSGLIPPYTQGGGRLSNGPLWNEYLGDRLGIPVNPATNFAVGGATTGTINTVKNDPNLPLGLPNINNLIGLEQQITGYIGSTASADPNALYLLWAGANDYLGAGVQNPTSPVTNLVNTVGVLAGHGAKNILVVNLPDLGALPATIGTPNAIPLNFLTQAHNSGLAGGLDLLRPSLPADVKVTLFDVNTLFKNVTQNPADYGLSDVTHGCLLIGCTNPEQFLFWDFLHPTTRGHQIIAASAARALGIPEGSMVWGLLGVAAIALGQVKRKTRADSSKIAARPKI